MDRDGQLNSLLTRSLAEKTDQDQESLHYFRSKHDISAPETKVVSIQY